ncbi:MAG TPA: response regulator [Chitinophagaceae bacterium]|nr:response regulator [Chitinophagaceae bacterium]
MKILLAEDDVDDQSLFHEFLHHRADIALMPVAENGVILIETLEQISNDEHLPQLIILDQNMPKRNGLQTLQLLKANNRYAHIPVMMYSTYTDQQLINKGSQMGAAVITSKPITKDGYNQMIDSFLEAILK